LAVRCVGYLWVLNSFSLFCVSVFMQYHTVFDYYHLCTIF
jgi:hypothetical protein